MDWKWHISIRIIWYDVIVKSWQGHRHGRDVQSRRRVDVCHRCLSGRKFKATYQLHWKSSPKKAANRWHQTSNIYNQIDMILISFNYNHDRSYEFIWFAPMQGDKAVVIAAVLRWAPALRFASERLRGDDEVVLAAVKSWGIALQFAEPEAIQWVDTVLVGLLMIFFWVGCVLIFWVTEISFVFFFWELPRFFWMWIFRVGQVRAQRHVVLEAVRSDGLALVHVSKELRDDEEKVRSDFFLVFSLGWRYFEWFLIYFNFIWDFKRCWWLMIWDFKVLIVDDLRL